MCSLSKVGCVFVIIQVILEYIRPRSGGLCLVWKRRQAALSSSAKLVAHTIWIVQFAFSCSVWRRRWRPWLRSDTEVTWGRDKENGGRWGDGFWRWPPTASLRRPSRGGTRIRKSNLFRAAGTSQAVAWRRRSVGAAQRLSKTIWQARLRHHHQCQQRLPSTNTTVEKDDRYAQSGKLNLSHPQNDRKVYFKWVILALKSM